MLYSEFITKLRSEVGDFGLRRFENADGDGTTSVFNLQHPKVLESSYTVKVGGVTKTETTDYTINRDTGQIIFVTAAIPASGNDNISFEYQSVNLTDADWIEVINNVLSELRNKLWIEKTDETSLITVADQVDYATAAVAADIIHLLNLEYKIASNDNWRSVRAITNAVFYKDLQKIHVRPPFSTAGYAMRVRVNRAYVQGSTSASTFEPQDRYHSVIKAFCKVKYMQRQAMQMMKETGAVSREKSFETITAITNLTSAFEKQARVLLAQVKPPMPAITIPHVIAGIQAI